MVIRDHDYLNTRLYTKPEDRKHRHTTIINAMATGAGSTYSFLPGFLTHRIQVVPEHWEAADYSSTQGWPTHALYPLHPR